MKNGWLAAGLIAGGLLLVLVFSTFPLNELLILLLGINPYILGIYVLVSLTIFILLSLRWQVILRGHGIKVPFRQLFAYKAIGFAISFVTPGPRVGGEPARAAMLKRNGVPFTTALSTAIADKTIELTSYGIMFIVSLLVALATLELGATVRAVLTLVTALISVLVFFGFYQMLQGRDPILKIFKLLRLHKIRWLRKKEKELQEFEDHIHGFYGENKTAFWKANVVSAVAWAFSLLEYYTVMRMLGLYPNFVEVFLVFSVVGVVYLLPVPLALGTFEAAQASLLAALGMSAAAGAAIALITRSRDLVWTMMGFALLSNYGLGAIKENEKE